MKIVICDDLVGLIKMYGFWNGTLTWVFFQPWFPLKTYYKRLLDWWYGPTTPEVPP